MCTVAVACVSVEGFRGRVEVALGFEVDPQPASASAPIAAAASGRSQVRSRLSISLTERIQSISAKLWAPWPQRTAHAKPRSSLQFENEESFSPE
jgi:hypothetical protein